MRRSTFTTASTAHPVRGTYGPLLKDPKGISLVLPDLSKTEWLQPKETDQTSVLAHIRDNRLLDFNDSVALARLTGMLGQWNKPYSVLLSSDATFEDLQRGPTILIGAVDNPWTMRFLQTLPYSVARRGTSILRNRRQAGRVSVCLVG